MIPPIPGSLVPVTAHQDVVRPRPDIAPVTPVQESSSESGVALDKRHPQDLAEQLSDEQRRRRRQPDADEPADGDAEEPGEDDEPPRLGGHVDITI